ncbi:MAG: ZIP family metal transporter [Desulfurococcales archaeon]|nr:ZIP family metal transporter [Desulfurococcales archaeon]
MGAGSLAYLESVSGGNPVITALVMSTLAAVLTGLGGFGVLLIHGPTSRRERLAPVIDLGLGFSSGVMIVAAFTSLLLPAIESSGVGKPLAGFVLGAVVIHLVNELVPHEHFVKGFEGPERARTKVKAAWLVALAIIIHNLPEGLSIGAASAYSVRDGIVIGLAIGIQDIPEGLAVAIPVYATSGSLARALAISWMSGASEILTAVPAALVGYSPVLLPVAMGFGAGAMIYVVSHEAIPETHRSGHEGKATLAFFTGFIVMLVLDTMLG